MRGRDFSIASRANLDIDIDQLFIVDNIDISYIHLTSKGFTMVSLIVLSVLATGVMPWFLYTAGGVRKWS